MTPLRTHPLVQSLQPLLAMALVLTTIAASLALIGTGTTAGPDWSRIADLGDGVLADAGWLLPALLSVNLGFVAVLFAQTVTSADAKLMATTRLVTTAGSALVGGSAAAVVLLSLAAAARAGGLAPRLFAILVLACTVIGISLWLSVLFFGAPAAQLAVTKQIRETTQATVDRLGSVEPVFARGGWAVNVIAIAGVSMLTYFGGSLAWAQPIPNPLGAVVVLTVLCAGTTLLICLAELGIAEWPSQRARQLARVVLVVSLFGPVILLGVGFLWSGLPVAGLALIAAVLLPILSALVPWGSRIRGWTLRAAIDMSTRKRLQKRLDHLQQHINELQKRNTLLTLVQR